MKTTYYHVIEDFNYGRLASHGYFKNENEAKELAERLQRFFPEHFFYVYASPSKRSPEIVNH